LRKRHLTYPVSSRQALAAAEDEKPIRFSSLFWNYFQFWPVILLSTLIGGMASYMYLRYTSPRYSAAMKVLIRDETSSGQISEATVFEDLGLISRSGNIENEMEVLQSVNLMRNVVNNLGLQHRYIHIGSIRDVDVYKDAPFTIAQWQPADSILNPWPVLIVRMRDTMVYSVQWGGRQYEGRFGESCRFPGGSLLLARRSGVPANAYRDDFRLILRSTDVAGASLSAGLTVKSIGKRSTVLEVSLIDEVQARARDVLNELARVYDQSNLDEKNQIYVNTIAFIDERLQKLTAELTDVESEVERRKLGNSVFDLSLEAPLIREESREYARSVSDAEIQLDIIRNIRSFLDKDPEHFDFIPSNVGINNLTLTGMLEQFNRLLLERQKAASVLGPTNPQLKAMDDQLATLRLNIKRNMDGLERDLSSTRKILSGKGQDLQNKLKRLPGNERALIEVQRQQSIKQNLYLYLLQKREEAELSRTVSVSNNKVVEPARQLGQVSPVRRNIWALGLGGGFMFPILLISLLQALNTRVRNLDDIRRHTQVPLLGLINYDNAQNPIAVTGDSRSVISEMFRLIRANLQFIGSRQRIQTIMVTSSVSGEGKSFVSLNLSITLALAGKRVLLLELDMRNPRIHRTLGLGRQPEKGITRYLADDQIDWHDLLRRSEVETGLDIITCGLIPPNPSELLMGERIERLFKEAADEYDYIVVDTAPVGLVSDALLLNRLADTTLYVVRKDVTSLSHLEIIEEAAALDKLPRPHIVMNAVRRSFLGYGEGYLYGYGDYRSGQPKSALRKWWRQLRGHNS
jgi:capsular exopolysaccharide synthesis family protein